MAYVVVTTTPPVQDCLWLEKVLHTHAGNNFNTSTCLLSLLTHSHETQLANTVTEAPSSQTATMFIETNLKGSDKPAQLLLLQAPASTRFLPSLSPVPSLAIATHFLVVPKPFTHPSLRSFCFFCFILVHPRIMFLHRQLPGFFCLCVYQFLHLFNDLILHSFTRSVLHSERAFDRILEYFLSYVQHLYFPTFILTSSFQID